MNASSAAQFHTLIFGLKWSYCDVAVLFGLINNLWFQVLKAATQNSGGCTGVVSWSVVVWDKEHSSAVLETLLGRGISSFYIDFTFCHLENVLSTGK